MHKYHVLAKRYYIGNGIDPHEAAQSSSVDSQDEVDVMMSQIDVDEPLAPAPRLNLNPPPRAAVASPAMPQAEPRVAKTTPAQEIKALRRLNLAANPLAGLKAMDPNTKYPNFVTRTDKALRGAMDDHEEKAITFDSNLGAPGKGQVFKFDTSTLQTVGPADEYVTTKMLRGAGLYLDRLFKVGEPEPFTIHDLILGATYHQQDAATLQLGFNGSRIFPILCSKGGRARVTKALDLIGDLVMIAIRFILASGTDLGDVHDRILNGVTISIPHEENGLPRSNQSDVFVTYPLIYGSVQAIATLQARFYQLFQDTADRDKREIADIGEVERPFGLDKICKGQLPTITQVYYNQIQVFRDFEQSTTYLEYRTRGESTDSRYEAIVAKIRERSENFIAATSVGAKFGKDGPIDVLDTHASNTLWDEVAEYCAKEPAALVTFKFLLATIPDGRIFPDGEFKWFVRRFDSEVSTALAQRGANYLLFSSNRPEHGFVAVRKTGGIKLTIPNNTSEILVVGAATETRAPKIARFMLSEGYRGPPGYKMFFRSTFAADVPPFNVPDIRESLLWFARQWSLDPQMETLVCIDILSIYFLRLDSGALFAATEPEACRWLKNTLDDKFPWTHRQIKNLSATAMREMLKPSITLQKHVDPGLDDKGEQMTVAQWVAKNSFKLEHIFTGERIGNGAHIFHESPMARDPDEEDPEALLHYRTQSYAGPNPLAPLLKKTGDFTPDELDEMAEAAKEFTFAVAVAVSVDQNDQLKPGWTFDLAVETAEMLIRFFVKAVTSRVAMRQMLVLFGLQGAFKSTLLKVFEELAPGAIAYMKASQKDWYIGGAATRIFCADDQKLSEKITQIAGDQGKSIENVKTSALKEMRNRTVVVATNVISDIATWGQRGHGAAIFPAALRRVFLVDCIKNTGVAEMRESLGVADSVPDSKYLLGARFKVAQLINDWEEHPEDNRDSFPITHLSAYILAGTKNSDYRRGDMIPGFAWMSAIYFLAGQGFGRGPEFWCSLKKHYAQKGFTGPLTEDLGVQDPHYPDYWPRFVHRSLLVALILNWQPDFIEGGVPWTVALAEQTLNELVSLLHIQKATTCGKGPLFTLPSAAPQVLVTGSNFDPPPQQQIEDFFVGDAAFANELKAVIQHCVDKEDKDSKYGKLSDLNEWYALPPLCTALGAQYLGDFEQIHGKGMAFPPHIGAGELEDTAIGVPRLGDRWPVSRLDYHALKAQVQPSLQADSSGSTFQALRAEFGRALAIDRRQTSVSIEPVVLGDAEEADTVLTDNTPSSDDEIAPSRKRDFEAMATPDVSEDDDDDEGPGAQAVRRALHEHHERFNEDLFGDELTQESEDESGDDSIVNDTIEFSSGVELDDQGSTEEFPMRPLKRRREGFLMPLEQARR